jgi:DNA transformation protein
MAVSKEYYQSVMEKLESLGEVTGKTMFGGYGIFFQDLMFAVISDDVLYFKVDRTNLDDYEKAGSTKFPHGLNYWEVTDEVFEDNAILHEWARKSINIALEAAAKKAKKSKGK